MLQLLQSIVVTNVASNKQVSGSMLLLEQQPALLLLCVPLLCSAPADHHHHQFDVHSSSVVMHTRSAPQLVARHFLFGWVGCIEALIGRIHQCLLIWVAHLQL